MANPVEGPSGHGQPAVRPPVAIAGVDASGNVRHLLLTSSGALSLAAASVEIGEVQILGADGLTLGVVTGTGAFKVDGSGVTQPVSLAAETTKVIGVTRSADGAGNLITSTSNALDINIKSGNLTTLPVTNTGTFAVQATLAAETTKVIGVARSADGSGNLLTSTTGALDVNLKTSALANQSVNNAQIVGTTVDVNSGNKSNGTQRVTLATDQVALTNALLTTPGGNVANAAADSGNPVKIGGVFNTTPPTLTNGQRGDMQLDTNAMPMVTLYNGAGSIRSVVAAPADTVTGAGGLNVNSFGATFNSATWDRQYGNYNTTTGDTGAKATAAFLGALQKNFNARGAIITCLVGTVTGAVTTWQTGIQWSFDAGTTWLELTPLGANDTAVSTGKTYTWIIYPTNTSQAAGVTPATLVPGTLSVAGPTQLNIVNAALPRTWRFAAQVSVATSIAITAVYVNYIL